MKHKNLVYRIIALAILLVIGITCYLFRPTPDSVCNKIAIKTLRADQLINEYETDEADANKLYLGKVVTVTGVVSSITNDDLNRLTIEFECQSVGTVIATLCKNESTRANIQIGETLSIKGECSGYTFDVILIKCCLSS